MSGDPLFVLRLILSIAWATFLYFLTGRECLMLVA